FLVAHLKRGGFDLDRLVTVLRKALHRVRHAVHRALRTGVAHSHHRERQGAGAGARRDPTGQDAAVGKHHPENHLELADLPATDGVRAGSADSAGAFAGCWSDASPEDRVSKFITTLPSNPTNSPPPAILRFSV